MSGLPRLQQKLKKSIVFDDLDPDRLASTERIREEVRVSQDQKTALKYFNGQHKLDDSSNIKMIQDLRRSLIQTQEDLKEKELFNMHLRQSNQKLLTQKSIQSQDQQRIQDLIEENKELLEKLHKSQQDHLIDQSNLRDFEMKYKNLEETLQPLENQLSNLKDEIKNKDNTIQQFLIQIEEQEKQRLKNELDSNQEFENFKEQKQNQINYLNQQIQLNEQKLKNFEQQINNQKTQFDQVQSQNSKQDYQINFLKQENQHLQENAEKQEKKLATQQKEIEDLNKQLENQEQKHQITIEELKNTYINQLENKQTQVQALQNDQEEIQNTHNQQIEAMKNNWFKKQVEFEKKIEVLENEIKILQQDMINEEDFQQLQQKNSDLQSNLQKLQSQKSQYTNVLNQIKKLQDKDDDITKQVNCNNCKNQLQQPITVIPCGHSFCLKCKPGYEKGYCGKCGIKGKIDSVYRNELMDDIIQMLKLMRNSKQILQQLLVKQD